MQIIDNINHIVKNDLQESIRTGSKLSIAAACFSIYAYQELKKQLESIDELRFIFTSPTFVTEKTALLMPLPQIKRSFYRLRAGRSNEQLVAEMAQIFQVSKQAMRIRLETRNLI